MMTTPSPLPTDEDRVCPFCQKISEGSVQREALRVYSFEPLNPVTPGHRLFLVDDHFAFPHHEPALAGLAYSAAARHAGEQGGAYNLIVNAGDAASQTIPHVHVHYVPRERNDGLKLPWTEQAEEISPSPLPGSTNTTKENTMTTICSFCKNATENLSRGGDGTTFACEDCRGMADNG